MTNKTKRIVLLLLTITLSQICNLFVYIPQASAYGPFHGGTGTAGDPYQLSTCQELQNIGGDDHYDFVLTNDIDCSASNTWNSGAGFVPMLAFLGVLNGNGHTISNLFINLPSNTGVGLFQTTLNGAIIENLTLTGANITGSTSVGILVGEVNTVNSGFTGPTYISGVSVQGTVSGSSHVGGLVGDNLDGIFDRDSSSGTISGNSMVGGLIGDSGNYASVTNAYSTANVTATGSTPLGFGGLIGEAASTIASVANSYSSGTVSAAGASYTGGLIGDFNAQTKVDNNFTVSHVVDNSTTAVGGFAGSYVTVFDGAQYSSHGDYYDQTATGETTCDNINDSSSGNPPGCIAVNTNGSQDSYFHNNSINAPLTSWDFTNIWVTTSGLPALRAFVPSLPSQPTISGGATSTNATLSWSTATTGNSYVPIQDYTVQYKIHGTNIWTTKDTGDTSTSTTINSLSPDTTYDLQVTAYDGEGAGPASTILQLTTLPTPVNTITSGSGSGANPYQITSCQDLQSMNFNLAAAYKLMGNIDCSDSSTWNNGAGFLSIGLGQDLSTSNFAGSLDGQGFTISGLYINQAALNSQHAVVGLIGALSGGSITNLKLTSATVIGGGNALVNVGTDYVGGVAGEATNASIKAVSFSGSVTSSGCGASMDIGGLVGSNVNGSITQSLSIGSVADSCSASNGVGNSIGGLVGYTNDTVFLQSVTIADDYSQASVHSNINDVSGIGGLIGFAGVTTISNSYSSGSISYAITAQRVGGLIGFADQFGADTLTHSFTSSPIDSVHCSLYCGALIGFPGTGSGVSSYNYATDYYDKTAVGLSQCDSSGNTTCNVINANGLNGSYFYNNNSNPPLNSWDFAGTWTTTSGLPVFGSYVNPNPDPPTSFGGSATSDSNIHLSWQAPGYTGSSAISQYQVLYEVTNSNSWTTIFTGSTGLSYDLSNLAATTSYSVQVVAQNSGNNTGYGSTIIQITTSPTSTYMVSTCDQLQAMNNDLLSTYKLVANIDCSATSSWNSGTGFAPIGTANLPFKGTLDGNKFSIKGLHSNQSNGLTGLFGATSAATIKDLTLDSPTMSGTYASGAALVGGLVAQDSNASTITNVQVNNAALSVIGGDLGGLIGVSYGATTISQSSVTGSLSLANSNSSNSSVGGLVGADASSSGLMVLTNDYSKTVIAGTNLSNDNIGGLVGAVRSSFNGINMINLTDSYAAGQINVTGSSSSDIIGGLIGYLYRFNGNTIGNSFSDVSINSNATSSYIGGVIGRSPDNFNFLDLSTDTFDIQQAGTSTCINTIGPSCNGINISGSQANYFDNNTSNLPLNNWNFTNIWSTTSDLPIFISQISINSDQNAQDSSILSGGKSNSIVQALALLQTPVDQTSSTTTDPSKPAQPDANSSKSRSDALQTKKTPFTNIVFALMTLMLLGSVMVRLWWNRSRI